MKRFEVVQNIPSPYRLHLFGELWSQLRKRGVDFHVNFMSDMSRGHDERPLSWRNPTISFPHRYWRDFGVGQYHFNPGMVLHLRRARPDYLLVGSTFDTFTSWAVSGFCKSGIRCAWSEGNTKTPGKLNGVRGLIKRIVFAQYPLIGVPGEDAAKYIGLHQQMTSLRMPKPIFLPNLIDETRFRPRQLWVADEISALRRKLGVDAQTRLCIIPARLERVKGLVEFVSLLTPEMIHGWRLVIMGQGPLHDEIVKTLKRQRLSEQVCILDFVPYSDMPKFYAAADLFLLPSLYDPNPLSVVEALHSGLPIALSDKAGNVEEAVSPGLNGWILPIDDKDAYVNRLRTIFKSDKNALQVLGQYSFECNSRFWATKDAVSRFLNEIDSFEVFNKKAL